MQDTYISLAHGNGGRYMRELINDIFSHYLRNPELDVQADAVPLNLNSEHVMFTTDGFIVQPLEFPGGDIGSLAVHGTTNDLAVSGATPLYLSLNAFIEEGMEVAQLKRIVASLASAAEEIGVYVVAGDTKVVRRGEGSGLYLATTGIGSIESNTHLGLNKIRNGDAVLVSGPIGDHGTSVMLAREQFGLRGNVKSDSASVLNLTQVLLTLDGLRFMRDPTRGGLATVCHEILLATGMGVYLRQRDIPVRDEVNSLCEILGYDPLFLACEGRVVAVIDPAEAEIAVSRWREYDNGKDAQIIGNIESDNTNVVIRTEIGGERIIEELEDDPLPRIC